MIASRENVNMKTKFNILSASLVGIVCASIMTPSFAASSVRSLGGAGTYTGTSSVRSNAAASTSGSAVSAARAGSIRINNGGATKTNTTASLRTPSTRSATAPRLSIGKYLAGSSALGGSSTGGNVNIGQSGVTADLAELKQGLADLEEEIKNLTGGETVVDFVYDETTGDLILKHGNDEYPVNLGTKDALETMQEQIDIIIANSGATIEADENTYIEITEDSEKNTKTVSAILSALDSQGALTDGLTTGKAVEGYVTGYVTDYAIPKPSDACVSGSTVCVLSVDTSGKYFWLELVDEVADESTSATTSETDVSETYESETYESESTDDMLTDL